MEKLTALITGASRGIGCAVARKMAENGINLVLICKSNIDKLNKLADELRNKYAISIETYKCDLSKKDEIDELYKSISCKVDFLVNNAGICLDKEVKDREIDDFDSTFRLNLFAPFYLSKLFGKKMMENEFGKIINISSNNATKCFYPTTIDYDSSKAGLDILTKNLAIEFSPYVNVNAVAPGWIDTDMNGELFTPDIMELEKEKILKKRIGTPEDVANLVYFLVSKDADYINGEVITIDGGMF